MSQSTVERLLESLNFREFLDALEGVAYIVSLDGHILDCGAGWDRFAASNGASALTRGSVMGGDLFRSILGDEVRNAYRDMHKAALSGTSALTFTFRCDAPEVRRTMRMAISAVRKNGKPVALLYQSQLLSANARPPMDIFAAFAFSHDGYPDFRADLVSTPIVSLCSFCQRIAWPIEPSDHDPIWVEAEDYYRRGGSSAVQLSHGICPECRSRVVP